jgi:hypothetical protein
LDGPISDLSNLSPTDAAKFDLSPMDRLTFT